MGLTLTDQHAGEAVIHLGAGDELASATLLQHFRERCPLERVTLHLMA